MAIVSINIPPRSRHCCQEEEEFTQGTEYYSLLEEGEEGFLRKDYCVPCWEKWIAEGGETDPSRIYWKSSVPVKKQGPDLSLRRDERALQLLKEIHQNESEEDLSQAFVLALLLARNRALQLRQEVTQDDGQVVLLYEVSDTEEMLCVKKIDHSGIPKQEVQQLLAERLNGKL